MYPFHCRPAVAPLKPAAHPQAHPAVGGFPSPKGGGPIEASPRGWGWRTVRCAFHRRKAVAPLKLPSLAVGLVPVPAFHRRLAVTLLKLPSLAVGLVPVPAFHRRLAVTLLKQSHRRLPARDQRSFHRRKAVAPLKLVHGVCGYQVDVPFPLPTGGGPIEALTITSGSRRTCPLSVPEWRWPHFIFRWPPVMAWRHHTAAGRVLAMLISVPL